MIEGIERLEPQLQSGSVLARREVDIFEQGEIEIEQSRSNNRVLPRIAETIVQTAIPRNNGICERTFVEPGVHRVGIADRCHLVHPISTDTPQAENIRARVRKAKPIAAYGYA